jgi:hypothetical protein
MITLNANQPQELHLSFENLSDYYKNQREQQTYSLTNTNLPDQFSGPRFCKERNQGRNNLGFNFRVPTEPLYHQNFQDQFPPNALYKDQPQIQHQTLVQPLFLEESFQQFVAPTPVVVLENPEKKRNQVKSACTNCRKVCKKCAIQRPCPRCVLKGLEDSCVDIPRKNKKIKLDSIVSSNDYVKDLISIERNLNSFCRFDNSELVKIKGVMVGVKKERKRSFSCDDRLALIKIRELVAKHK